MNEILQYRLPGRKSVFQTGTYREVESFEGVKGFVISTFDKTRKFVFQESNDNSKEYYFQDYTPNCCSKEEYIEGANKLLNLIAKGECDKVVYSRVIKVDQIKDVNKLFLLLCMEYPSAFVYLISSPLFGTWVGASPEKLIESYGVNANTVALAGTRGVDEIRNFGDKEVEEQNYVTKFMEEVLNKNLITEVIKNEQRELEAGPVKHLANEFEFCVELDRLPKLIDDLHPTPAVCGVPRDLSLEKIKELEGHKRDLYAGYLGVINNDSAALYVNLRCAQLNKNASFLYVGGGYTKDSVIEEEWKETENKSRTLMDIIEKM